MNAPALRPPPANDTAEAVEEDNMPPIIDFDQADVADGDKAQDHARSVKVEFNPSDIRFWFSELEAEMTTAGIGKQWLKKTVLQRNLPTKQKTDVKALLTLNQTQAGNDIYYRIKQELIRLYAPRPRDSYCKALTRTMVGLPSQLGAQIVDDVCKRPDKLNGCCCASAVEALWHLQLPTNIRAHTSNMTFDHSTYKNVFEAADKVFLASKQVSVAGVQVVAAVDMDETQPAFKSHNVVQEVAAVSAKGQSNRGNNRGGSGRGGGRGGRGNRGGRAPGTRPPRHSSNPPESCCDRHYQHGDQAYYCQKPLSCPWVSKVIAK